jgi:hypothetical protein
MFYLNALLDIGLDMNLLNKNLIPCKYWLPSNYSAIGLGNVSTDFDFEFPKGVLWFDQYALVMKFLLAYLPVDCILGTPFLAVVEPHGSARTAQGHPAYSITIPSITKGYPPVKKILSFISNPQSNSVFFSSQPKSLVIINTWDDLNNRPVTEQVDDNLDWETYSQNWDPHWELRWSEGIEFGLPGFSSNMSIHVIPPQHLIGRMHQASTLPAREKLIEMGDITTLRSTFRRWFCQNYQE